MTDILAIITIIFWPIIPIYWIPVHYASKITKNIGRLMYIVPIILWLPLAYLMYKNRTFFLQYKIDFPFYLHIIGMIFLITGTALHIWTARLLGLWGITGLPEISIKVKGRLVTEGPFSLVRHPTYLAHTVIFSGIFLMTEVVAIGIITLIDLITVNVIIIPLEERELLKRFGEEYLQYKKKVVSKFIPWAVIHNNKV